MNNQHNKTKVWYDVSELQNWHGNLTGIQRVIFNIGKELSESDTIEIKPFRFDSEQKIFTETTYDFTIFESKQETVSADTGTHTTKITAIVKKSLPAPIKTRLKKVKKLAKKDNTLSGILPIDIKENEIMFSPGAFWTGFIDSLTQFKQEKQFQLYAVMYDLVPVVTPQFCAEATVKQYGIEIDKALNIVDHWLSISENTKRDLEQYANKPVKVDVIRLGSDINPDIDESKPLGQILPEHFILMVSTIEARKNQMLLYQVARLAKEKGVDIPSFVLVGKHGWLSDDFIYMLKHDPEISGKIIWINDADDRNLKWLYSNCLYTVYPSYYEGWGLPVAESLAHEKICLASKSSSITEIAGDTLEYFSPYSPEELLQLIVKYSDRSKLNLAESKLLKHQVTTWQDTGQQVIGIISSHE